MDVNLIRNIYLSKEDIYNSFSETFFITSKNSKNKILLFKKCKIINFDCVKSVLIKQPEWLYHYYIPQSINFDALLLLGFNTDKINLNKYKNLLGYENYENNSNLMLNFLINNLDWKNENIFFHSCNWSDQMFFGELIDNVTSGIIFNIPNHWGCPNY